MMHLIVSDDGYQPTRCRVVDQVIHLPSADTLDLHDVAGSRLSICGLFPIDNEDGDGEYVMTDEVFAYFEARMADLRPVIAQVFGNCDENKEAADDPRNPREHLVHLASQVMQVTSSLAEHLLYRMSRLGGVLPGIAMRVSDKWEGMPIPNRYARKPVI